MNPAQGVNLMPGQVAFVENDRTTSFLSPSLLGGSGASEKLDEAVKTKVLAIASVGGHWVQLLRIRPAFRGMDLSFMSTKASFASMVPGHTFYAVPDANRWNKLKLLQSFWVVCKIIFKVRPQVIVTTGAAPGLMGIIAGRLIGAKTIWIDSIANVEQVSLSGKIALRFADRVYTQWPDLADSKVMYGGNVLS